MLSIAIGAKGVLCFSLLVVAVAQEYLVRNNEVLIVSCAGVQGEVLELEVSGELSDTITVTSDKSCLSDGEIQGLSIQVFSSNATEEYPLVVVARQGMREKIFSWRIPYYPAEHNISFRSVDRTLCPVNISSEQELVYLDVYTTSPQPIHYQVSAQLLPNFNLQFNDSVQFLVTPASPKILYFKFPTPETEGVLIKLDSLAPRSPSSGCFILSAQRNSCPFHYLVEDVQKSGFYQTVNTTTVLEVKKNEISEEIIIAIVAIRRTRCSSKANSSIYSNETFNLTIVESPPLSEFNLMMGLPIIVFFVGVVPIVIIFTMLHIFTSCDYKLFCKIRLSIYKCGEHIKGETNSKNVEEGSPNTGANDMDEELHNSTEHRTVYNRSRSANVQDYLEEEAIQYIEDQRKKFPPVKCGKEICCKHIKYTKHFMNKTPTEDYPARVNRRFTFLWNTIIISVYYGLPALQHLYTLIQITKFTGETDRCYFNFKCAHSLGKLTSFNNFWSNIAYLLFGALFLVIAVVKNITYCVKRRKEKFIDHLGLPEYFGMYYAMGVLAIMQGCMSAFYHICPTKANFQYDNASMVIFGGLVIVHIVYKRHPVERVNAGLTYVLFAFITSLILLGLIADGLIGKGWEPFLDIVFFLLALNFTFAFYRLHDWNFLGGCVKPKDGDNLETSYTIWIITWIKHNKWKIIKLMFATIMNLIIAIVYFSKEDMSFGTAVLTLLIINDMFFIMFYILAKVYYKEYFSLMSTVTGILTVVFVIPAAFFLSHTEYVTEETPSLSRQSNRECSFGNFYDYHDMWHFLSSIAMFFCYVHILTLDDGVSHKRRSKIHAF